MDSYMIKVLVYNIVAKYEKYVLTLWKTCLLLYIHKNVFYNFPFLQRESWEITTSMPQL